MKYGNIIKKHFQVHRATQKSQRYTELRNQISVDLFVPMAIGTQWFSV